jgi:hypothetical protein
MAQTVIGYTTVALLNRGSYTELHNLTTALLVLNAAVQIALAVLFAVRLLDPRDVKYLPKEHRARRFQFVGCLVESGLLVAVTLIIELALFMQDIAFHWVFVISLPQLYAITTVYIILRMGSFADRHLSAMPGSSHSGEMHMSSLRDIIPSNVRSPVSVMLHNATTSPGIDDARKSQIADPHDGIELQGYHAGRRDIKATDVYINVETDVHHEA